MLSKNATQTQIFCVCVCLSPRYSRTMNRRLVVVVVVVDVWASFWATPLKKDNSTFIRSESSAAWCTGYIRVYVRSARVRFILGMYCVLWCSTDDDANAIHMTTSTSTHKQASKQRQRQTNNIYLLLQCYTHIFASRSSSSCYGAFMRCVAVCCCRRRRCWGVETCRVCSRLFFFCFYARSKRETNDRMQTTFRHFPLPCCRHFL